VLDLSNIDLEEIANALADQTDYQHHWLISPDRGEIVLDSRHWRALRVGMAGDDGRPLYLQHFAGLFGRED
jgi:hypothetical protein